VLKLVDVLTKEERNEIDRLKLALLKAETRKDIKFYRKQIDEILDKVEQRYYNMEQPDI
jgi:hypothetical protein